MAVNNYREHLVASSQTLLQ